MNSNTLNRIDPYSPAMLVNPFAVPVPSQMAGGYGCLGALLSVLYVSFHWTMAASVFYSVMMIGMNRDRQRVLSRQEALTINQLAALAWAKIEKGAESSALQELMRIHQCVPANPQVQFYLSRALTGVDSAQGKKLMQGYMRAMRDAGQRCDMRAYVTMGQHCAALGHIAEADLVWREGQRQSTDATLRVFFVVSRALLFVEKNPGQALEILESFSEGDARLGSAARCNLHYWRGRCLAAVGEAEWATQEFQAVAAINPYFEDVAKRLPRPQ